MKLYIMSLPWRGSRRSRLCLLLAERRWDDVSTSWCPSAWLAFSIILVLRQVSPLVFDVCFGRRDHLIKALSIQSTTLTIPLLSAAGSLQPAGFADGGGQESVQGHGVGAGAGAGRRGSEERQEDAPPAGTLPQPLGRLRHLLLLHPV